MRTRRGVEDGSAEPRPEILADLTAVLAADRAVYLKVGPEGAVLSVKAPELLAFGESIGMKWRFMKPEERASAVLDVFQRAGLQFSGSLYDRFGVLKCPGIRAGKEMVGS